MLTLPIDAVSQHRAAAVAINATYPGASAQTVENTVTQVIEQQLTGLDNLALLLVREQRRRHGDDHADLRAGHQSRHRPGAGAEQAAAGHAAAAAGGAAAGRARGQVDAQLPAWCVGFISDERQHDATTTSPTTSPRTCSDPLSRVAGVGDVQLFGTQYAMRIWLDPAKLNNYQPDAGRRDRRDPGAERPGRRPASSAALPAVPGPAAQRHHHGPIAPADARAVRNIILQASIRTARRCAWATSRASSSAPRTTSSTPSTTASPPPASPIKLAPGANALDTVEAVQADARRAASRSSRPA